MYSTVDSSGIRSGVGHPMFLEVLIDAAAQKVGGVLLRESSFKSCSGTRNVDSSVLWRRTEALSPRRLRSDA